MSINEDIAIDSNSFLLPNTDQWLCPTCSSRNLSSDYPICQRCEQIHSQFIEDSSLANSSKQMWKCSSCTWRNHPNYIICESCFRTKPGSVNLKN